MKKADLKDGMVVELRDSACGCYIVNDGYLKGYATFCPIYCYSDDLKEVNHNLDIMKIYTSEKSKTINDMLTKKHLTLIWERKEYPKLTKYEKETLERMRDVEYSWIARNGQGYICATFGKPQKRDMYWVATGKGLPFDFLNEDFDFIKWEDSEPWNIQELLENCEVEE